MPVGMRLPMLRYEVLAEAGIVSPQRAVLHAFHTSKLEIAVETLVEPRLNTSPEIWVGLAKDRNAQEIH